MKIVWLPLALTDISRIQSYYFDVAGKTVTNRYLKKVVKSAKLLQTQPYMGHISPNETDTGVREWHVPNTTFTLPYYIQDDEIRILRVFDQRQERPESWVQ